MKTTIYAITFSFMLTAMVSGQTQQLLYENFNSGFPATWTQNPANSWTLHPTFGVSGTPCMITEEAGSNTLVATITTHTLNLTGISNPTVNFKAAITKNNFLPGNLILYYDQGTGPQFVARWGSGFTSNTTYTIPEDGFDPVAPLDSENIFWHSYSQTITPSGNTVKIILAAEFVNGGYILFDSIAVVGKTISVNVGLSEMNPGNSVSIFPNPVINKKTSIYAEHFKALAVFNQLGENVPVRIERETENSFELDVSCLSAGIYYLSLTTENNMVTNKKLIVE